MFHVLILSTFSHVRSTTHDTIEDQMSSTNPLGRGFDGLMDVLLPYSVCQEMELGSDAVAIHKALAKRKQVAIEYTTLDAS